MVVVKYPLRSLTAWGKQRGTFAGDAPIPPNMHDPELCIYQRRRTKRGIITVKEKYYKPSNQPSDAQRIHRKRFAAAVRAWQDLSGLERALWTDRGEQKRLPGYQAFLCDYLRGRVA